MSMTTSENTTINNEVFNRVHLLRRFISIVGIDVNDIIDSYVGQVFNCGLPKQKVFKEFLQGQISNETARTLGQACASEGLANFRDKRNPESYACELVIGWLFEDAVYLLLEKADYQPSMSGTDKDREFLNDTQIASTSDFRVFIDGTPRSLEVVSDYGNFWSRSNKCDLRHSKAGASEIILGIALQKPAYFVFDFTKPQPEVVLTESVWHEAWNKPVKRLQGIASIMKPLKNGLVL